MVFGDSAFTPEIMGGLIQRGIGDIELFEGDAKTHFIGSKQFGGPGNHLIAEIIADGEIA